MANSVRLNGFARLSRRRASGGSTCQGANSDGEPEGDADQHAEDPGGGNENACHRGPARTCEEENTKEDGRKDECGQECGVAGFSELLQFGFGEEQQGGKVGQGSGECAHEAENEKEDHHLFTLSVLAALCQGWGQKNAPLL